ncbi:MAG: phosphoadenylyl-sulfate reductase [Hyphomonadaceae bacterium]|nr:phosphoadenylyl-sulfate reductase [Hyphomonadaceae bacterium]
MTADLKPIHDSRSKAEAALDLLVEAAATPGAVLANSLSAEDMVLTDLLVRAGLPVRIVTLDTGMLPAASHELLERAQAHFGIEIEVFAPEASDVAGFVAAQGSAYSFYDSLEARKTCCALRKVVPLDRALAGASSWITGMRREQADSRAGLQAREHDHARSVPKYNPLADWSWSDVLDYTATWEVPISTLYQRGYVSIGCDPCTRALKPGEHPRMGRWWWETDAATKECGLHV